MSGIHGCWHSGWGSKWTHGLRAGRRHRLRIITIPTSVPVRHPLRPLPLRDPTGLAVAAYPEAVEPLGPGPQQQREWLLESQRQAQAIPVAVEAAAADLRVAEVEEDGELDRTSLIVLAAVKTVR